MIMTTMMTRARQVVLALALLLPSVSVMAEDVDANGRMPLQEVLRKLDGQRFDVRGIEYHKPWWVAVLRTPRGLAMTAGFDGVTAEMREDFPVERLPGTIPSGLLTASQALASAQAAGIGEVQSIRYTDNTFKVVTKAGATVVIDARSGAIIPEKRQ
jgi:hypothetical protein